MDPIGGEAARLRQKADKNEKLLELMKKANRIIRRKPKNESTPQKIAELQALGLKDEQARGIFKPDALGDIGFAPYQLTSVREKVKRQRMRAGELEKKERLAKLDDVTITGDGVTVLLCYAEDRIRIEHETKPSETARRELKREGWRWSRRNTCWQRQLTRNACDSARRLVQMDGIVEAHRQAGG
jgi:hypothetical protein